MNAEERSERSKSAPSKGLLGCALLSVVGLLLAVVLFKAASNENTSAKTHEAPDLPAGFVSAPMFQAEGKAWPLSVPTAVLGCEKGALLWVEINGTRYGLNGAAKDFGYPDFREYWLFDRAYLKPGERPSDGQTPRLNIQPLFERAQQLC